jgi:hypothetical protein
MRLHLVTVEDSVKERMNRIEHDDLRNKVNPYSVLGPYRVSATCIVLKLNRAGRLRIGELLVGPRRLNILTYTVPELKYLTSSIIT